jgi:hypothetical protein
MRLVQAEPVEKIMNGCNDNINCSESIPGIVKFRFPGWRS